MGFANGACIIATAAPSPRLDDANAADAGDDDADADADVDDGDDDDVDNDDNDNDDDDDDGDDISLQLSITVCHAVPCMVTVKSTKETLAHSSGEKRGLGNRQVMYRAKPGATSTSLSPSCTVTLLPCCNTPCNESDAMF